MSGGSDAKEYASNARDTGFDPWWVRKILWRREWLPTPVFLPGELRQKSNITEQLIHFKLYITKHKVLLELHWAAQRVCSSFPRRWYEKPD